MDNTIGKRLKKARLDAGFEISAEFARSLNIEPTTYWRYEHDKIRPGTENMLKIARETNVDAGWLQWGSE